jgi:hypothetical protein
VVRGRVHRAVPRVRHRVVHAPAVEQRTLGAPPAAIVVAREQEESLACADECQDGDGCIYLDRGVMRHVVCETTGATDRSILPRSATGTQLPRPRPGVVLVGELLHELELTVAHRRSEAVAPCAGIRKFAVPCPLPAFLPYRRTSTECGVGLIAHETRPTFVRDHSGTSWPMRRSEGPFPQGRQTRILQGFRVMPEEGLEPPTRGLSNRIAVTRGDPETARPALSRARGRPRAHGRGSPFASIGQAERDCGVQVTLTSGST